MTKYYCDICGKEENRLREVRIPHCKALGNSIALPPWKWVLKRLLLMGKRD